MKCPCRGTKIAHFCQTINSWQNSALSRPGGSLMNQNQTLNGCMLPHFPVVRTDNAMTRVRIVFDASVEVNGKSVNTESLSGPKLQTEVFDILVRSRKEPVALVGDISQMYHQV